MVYILSCLIFITLLFYFIGITRILGIIFLFSQKDYWTNYNIVEFAAWMAKAIIIIPGLLFGVELWYLHFITLSTSSVLIWASMKKSLPTLILFNTLWIIISITIIIKNLL